MLKRSQSVGKHVRKARKSAGITQEKLGELVNLSPKYIQYIESSRRNPSLKTLYKIARALRLRLKT